MKRITLTAIRRAARVDSKRYTCCGTPARVARLSIELLDPSTHNGNIASYSCDAACRVCGDTHRLDVDLSAKRIDALLSRTRERVEGGTPAVAKLTHDSRMEALAERLKRQDEAYRRLGQFVVEALIEGKPVSEAELAHYGSHSATKLAWIYNAALGLELVSAEENG